MNKKTSFEMGREHYLKNEYDEAVRWFIKGILERRIVCLAWLGRCYEKGQGVERNLSYAKDLYYECINYINRSGKLGVWLQERLEVLKDIPILKSDRRFIEGLGNVKVMRTEDALVPISVRYNKDEIVIQVALREALLNGFIYAENNLPRICAEWTCDGVNKFYDGYTLETDFFTLKVIADKISNYKCVINGRNLTVLVPNTVSFENIYVQAYILKKVKELLFKRAEIVIPEKLKEVADRTGTSYKKCRVVMSNRSWLAVNCDWGSLIQFCAKCIQLPEKSLEAICIHELAHNFVGNHSSKFKEKMIELGGEEAYRLDQNLFNERRWPYIRF